MKHSLTAVLLALSTSVAAASRMSVDALPEPVRPLAEVETNVAFSVGMPGENLWRLSIELDTTTSNCVEVVIGTDADGDGALGIDEGEFSVGWSCGEWFWRDRLGGGTGRVAGAEVARRLDWTLRLTEEKTARSVVGNVFSGSVDPTCFNPAWNMIRVVSRGTVSLRVESKVTVDALKLRVR